MEDKIIQHDSTSRSGAVKVSNVLDDHVTEQSISNLIRHLLAHNVEADISNATKEADSDREAQEELDVKYKCFVLAFNYMVQNASLIAIIYVNMK